MRLRIVVVPRPSNSRHPAFHPIGCYSMHRVATTWAVCAAVCLLGMGCRPRSQPTAYDVLVPQEHAQPAAYYPDDMAAALAPVSPTLAGPHAVEDYVAYALSHNPEIHAAKSRVAAAAYRVPQAASLRDPRLDLTYLPEPVETAAGEQRFRVKMSQEVPWPGKLQTRAGVAEAETNARRANLASMELEIIDEVKQAYYRLYLAEQSLQITRQDRALLNNLAQLAKRRLETGKVSQQDLLRAQLEVANVDSELIRIHHHLDTARARLARLLHVSPETKIQTLGKLGSATAPQTLDTLYARAIASRPELHARLAELDRDLRRADLACLERRPDVTGSVAWFDTKSTGISPVADGQDAWLLGISANVPIYRKRINAAVNEAEAQASATRRSYEALRDKTQEEVSDLFLHARHQAKLIDLFRQDILPRASQTLKVSMRAYEVGDIDFLQLIDNWRQVLRFKLAEVRAQVELRQAIASLERLVGGRLEPEGELIPPGR